MWTSKRLTKYFKATSSSSGKLCDLNENCVDLPTGYECFSHCASNPCSHGQCLNQIESYECQCEQGWEGTNCDIGKKFLTTL